MKTGSSLLALNPVSVSDSGFFIFAHNTPLGLKIGVATFFRSFSTLKSGLPESRLPLKTIFNFCDIGMDINTNQL